TPQEIYRQPDSRFVADFVGSSNVLPPGFVASVAGEHRWASLRPESIRLTSSDGHEARVTASEFLGSSTQLTLYVGEQRLHAMVPSASAVPVVGDNVSIDWDRQDMHLMEEGV
ncbi:MAG: TOBE domain-containing protein, partial [Gammaproteobacteria bacterium]